MLGVLCGIAVLIADQWSKWLVVRELGPDAGRGVVTIIPGYFRLFWVRNTGSAFGFFQGGSDILKFLALGGVLLLAVYFARAARSDWLIAVALGLQIGGAAGNLIDRFNRGYVVDWIDVSRWPTFNIADSAITVGVILLMYALLFRQPEPETVASKQSLRSGGADGMET
jgi:signal peptidase II